MYIVNLGSMFLTEITGMFKSLGLKITNTSVVELYYVLFPTVAWDTSLNWNGMQNATNTVIQELGRSLVIEHYKAEVYIFVMEMLRDSTAIPSCLFSKSSYQRQGSYVTSLLGLRLDFE